VVQTALTSLIAAARKHLDTWTVDERIDRYERLVEFEKRVVAPASSADSASGAKRRSTRDEAKATNKRKKPHG
jgi:predicted ATPase